MIDRHTIPNDVACDRNKIKNYAMSVNNSARRHRYWTFQEIGRIPAYDLLMKMEHQNHACIYCNQTITFDTCELDHVYPLARGGGHYLYNVAFACRICNNGKRAKTLTSFCKKRGFDVDDVRQRMADINQKLHDMLFLDDYDDLLAA